MRHETDTAANSVWLDALRYALRSDVALVNAIYCVGRVLVLAMSIVWLEPLAHALLTLGICKYGFECLSASALGRDLPPDAVIGDRETHRRHLLLQAFVLLILIVAMLFLPDRGKLVVVALLALAWPGAVLTLRIAQNLIAAINPRSWWIVATRLQAAYVLLAAAAFLVLWALGNPRAVLDDLEPKVAVLPLFYFAVQFLLIALFRALGTLLNRHASSLEFDTAEIKLPPIERDRQREAQARECAQALALSEPVARAAALATVVRGGADAHVHREYRLTLRVLGLRDELRQHAVAHICELLALKQARAALALASEALDDDPTFTLTDAVPLTELLSAGEGAGFVRQVAAIAQNYCAAYPRRYDTLPICLHAASLHADRLGDRERARELLERGAALAADGPEAPEFERLRQRLQAALPLRALVPAEPNAPPGT